MSVPCFCQEGSLEDETFDAKMSHIYHDSLAYVHQDTFRFIDSTNFIKGQFVYLDSATCRYCEDFHDVFRDSTFQEIHDYIRFGEWIFYDSTWNIVKRGNYSGDVHFKSGTCLPVYDGVMRAIPVGRGHYAIREGDWDYYNSQGELVKINTYCRGILIFEQRNCRF